MSARSTADVLLRPLRALSRFKHQHALLVAAAVASLAGGLSALAMAVAPMAPDIDSLPRRTVTVPAQPLALAPQLEALAAHSQEFSRSLVVRGPDNIAALLRRAGVLDTVAGARLAADETLKSALAAKGARLVELRTDAQGQLRQLGIRQAAPDQAPGQFLRLTAREVDGQWVTTREQRPLEVGSRFASGVIRSSLFGATDDAGLPDAVATQLVEIFGSGIDFHRELRKGDTFSVVYESLTADGEPVPWSHGSGRVLAAEFVNAGRSHQAIWFEPGPGASGGYFDFNGHSRKRAFLASPLEFSRVTSGFAMRTHPIWKDKRAHRGVDYRAPVGTAVRAVGDGVVSFAGWQNGYGKVVEVRHAQERSTLYAHLSQIDVKVGQRLEQGQTLGAVGATGWATGPHLHFEFRVAGEHQDPLLVARQTEQATLDAQARQAFAGVARGMQAQLVLAQGVALAPGRGRFE